MIMEIHQNLTKSISSKRGAISFVFSKFAFIIFAVIIAGTFFYVVSTQHEIQNLNRMVKTSESISNIIEMVSASKYNVSIIYEVDMDLNISFEDNQSFTVFNGNKLKRTTLFPINNINSESNISISCLNITNINSENTVIRKCQ